MSDVAIVDQLFYNRYWVHVEERAFYTTEQLETFGFYGEETEEGAMAALARLREVKITIPMLAEYHDNGYKLRLSNLKDAAEMFHIVNTHMNNWLQICNLHGYVNPMPPIEDFESLDRLAEKLFPYRHRMNLADLFDPFANKERDKHDLITLVGSYEPFAPKLYPYCKQVYGD